MVVRKINSLRSAFRREYRKKCNNQDYEVRLWYFDKLLFIAKEKSVQPVIYPSSKRRVLKVDEDSEDFLMMDQKPNIKSSDSTADHEIEEILQEEEDEEEDHVEPIEVEVEQKNKQLNNTQTFKILDISSLQASNGAEIQNALDTQNPNNHTNVQSIPTIQITKDQFPQLFTQSYPQQQNQNANQSAAPTPQSPSNNSQKMNDEYDAIGLNVAVKLRSMNSHQRIIAEKLIGDVLFNGQLNTLSITSHLTQ